MRPVRLDMNGFAGFREPTIVDFTEADYFALVGPTGSGKSTIIDAMTFALYGTAPRWGRANGIKDALAPTANRCAVRLIFDVGGTRYAVAREVRRIGKAIQQKNVVLERFVDPNAAGGPDDAIDVIAGEIKETSEKIQNLLGLSFDDFCQCVVLPQGRFAQFLHAKPGERQDILLKLLGAEQYETIGAVARERASLAKQKADLLETQAEELLAGATRETEEAARAREQELAELAAATDRAVPVINQATRGVEDAIADLATLNREHEQLEAIRVPADVGDLQTALGEATVAVDQATAAEAAATRADNQAREAMATGPDRRAVERLLDLWGEHRRLASQKDAVIKAAQDAEDTEATAATAVEQAEEIRDQAFATRDTAAKAQSHASSAHQLLLDRRKLLGDVTLPAGVEDLVTRERLAREQLARAAAQRAEAETAEEAAREALTNAPADGPLRQALADLEEHGQTVTRLERLRGEQAASQAEIAQEMRLLTAAEERYETTVKRLAAARDAAAAATLRPHLVAGQPCPVCEQDVAALPRPLEAPAVEAATADERAALQVVEQTQSELDAAKRTEVQKGAVVHTVEERLQHLDALLDKTLAGRPRDPDVLKTELARLDRLRDALGGAVQQLRESRLVENNAISAMKDLDAEVATAWTRLRVVHGQLLAHGVPTDVDGSDLRGAWSTITQWVDGQMVTLATGELPTSRVLLTAAEHKAGETQAALDNAQTDLRKARAEHTATLKHAEQASATCRHLTDRLTELDAELSGRLTAEQAQVQVQQCAALEAAAQAASVLLRQAREHRDEAEKIRAERDRRANSARQQLRSARDPLVRFGAPQLDDTDVAAAWQTLHSWAEEECSRRAQNRPDAEERVASAEAAQKASVDGLLAQLIEHHVDPAAHGIDVSPKADPISIRQTVAVLFERAQAETRVIVKNRQSAEALAQQIKATREEQHVAELLARLMRANNFPQWLASAALDDLVERASASLRELSAGQFDLTHQDGEFYVIDHTDADATRTVRTLSGGETFQASLALALALSAQVSTVAAQGTAKLDSLFLDEGFGSLDLDSLEVVAETLENLAHGDRMVGVVTHVAALAERAPIRYRVSRANGTSVVVREGA